ncbi:MAG TPA: YXWGXW repeat-containing protein [Ramlibacter sp.]|nr:YXWGXW repeat-containing protein [Ramlibacter sp.]
MLKKTTLAALATAASLLALAPAVSNAQITIIREAPPAPVQEVAPPARPGFVWAPGHQEWRDNHYVWVPGQWMRDRQGYAYREHRWVQRGDGQWHLAGGNWERRGPGGDRDGDGIANRHDRDRDGDGIPNRLDNRPNQPHHPGDYASDQRGWRRHFGPNGDIDRDGILNKDDRDRDGDGVRNRVDRYPDDYRRS